MRAIKRLKAKSARGFDAVSAQELKLLPQPLIEMLRDICDQQHHGFPAWMMAARVCPLSKTDDIPQPSQSRPICIMSQVYRLFAAVWCTQILQYWASWFPDDICGMLPKRGSHTAAYSVQADLEASRILKVNFSGITLDIKKCFNCIRFQCGWRLLVKLGLPYERTMQWFNSITKIQRY
jgi:hypothetical protein